MITTNFNIAKADFERIFAEATGLKSFPPFDTFDTCIMHGRTGTLTYADEWHYKADDYYELAVIDGVDDTLIIVHWVGGCDDEQMLYHDLRSAYLAYVELDEKARSAYEARNEC